MSRTIQPTKERTTNPPNTTFRAICEMKTTNDELKYHAVKVIQVLDDSVVYKQSKLSHFKMEELRQQQIGIDVFINCIDGTIGAHKVVLMSSCHYFEKMLTTDMSEKKSGEINFTIFTKSAMEIIVQYLYTAQLPNLTKDDDLLTELISSCHLMQIRDLLDHCWNRLTDDVTMETFPKLWTVATKFDLYQRDCNLLSFLRNNVELFANNENIQLLTEAEMALFIECVNDSSTSTRHNVIAKCIFNWKCDKKCREAPAVRLFKKIRVDHLDEETVYQLLELNHNGKNKTVQDVMIGAVIARFYERLNAFNPAIDGDDING
uniref:BTB domain-containing protein n=1 Tax=Strigamia maritima TaxID=126957 RepID=T1ITB7_STRMM